MLVHKALQYDIQFQQSTPAAPAGALQFLHTVLFTIISLILPMARVGFNPLGHASTQFIMEWQRNRRYGSSRLSSRSALAWSRLSARKRYACNNPAGPTNLSGFLQNEGHAVVQHAHRMHSYNPSSSALSSGDC